MSLSVKPYIFDGILIVIVTVAFFVQVLTCTETLRSEGLTGPRSIRSNKCGSGTMEDLNSI